MNNKVLAGFSFCASLLSFTACASKDPEQTYERITVATYNTGLARGYVDYADLRFGEQLEVLKQEDSVDILCLQEVWSVQDRASLIEYLAERYPFSVFENTTNDSIFGDVEVESAACTPQEAEPLAECARPLCSGEADLATCVLSNCGELFQAMSDGCQGCAAANIGLGSVDDILSICLNDARPSYTYDGQNGLLLFSTEPIESGGFNRLGSFLTARGVLSARTHGVDVYCTHLTSDLNEPAYGGAYESYAQENAAQIREVLDLITARDNGNPLVLLGDFNTGPDKAMIRGELSSNFEQFIIDGWSNFNVDGIEPLCTWCSDNTIVSGGLDLAIDHIFLKRAEVFGQRRLFDEPVSLIDRTGMVLTTSLSDHYGLAQEIVLP